MPRFRFVICALVVLGACIFVGWGSARRVERIDYVTSLADGSITTSSDLLDAKAAERRLIVPNRNEPSFHWLAQTEQMLVAGQLRVRQVDYDNAPAGRDVAYSSPYRWYLGGLALAERHLGGGSNIAAVESVARWADPLLLVFLVLAGGLIFWRRLGPTAAAVFGVGAVTLFPFGSEFLPGMPDDWGLALAGVIGSVAAVCFGIEKTFINQASATLGPGERRTTGRGEFAAAGVIGGVGVWISPAVELPILASVFLGGLIVAWIRDWGKAERNVAPGWRVWSVSGAATILIAYVIELAPAHLGGMRWGIVHPAYGIAWVAAGELLARVSIRRESERSRVARWSDGIVIAVTSAVLLTLAFILLRAGDANPFLRTEDTARLARVPDAALTTDFAGWAKQASGTLSFWATLAPLLVLLPAVALLVRRSSAATLRARMAMAVAAVVVALAMALTQLRWWAAVDATLLVLGAMLAPEWPALRSRGARAAALALAVAIAVVSVLPLWPAKTHGKETPLNGAEAQLVIERNLGRWLATHAGESRAVVYAPPHETLALTYYGDLRGLGTFAPENRAGFAASVMLAGASTMEAVQALLDSREVHYVVIPSWDPFFENFARLYLAQSLANRPSLLAHELRRLNLPPWLKPVPYQMPPIGGFENQWVLVFEVVEEQSPVVATSRLADFLVEMGDLDRAAAVGEALKKYPGNVGALAASAQVQMARNDGAGAQQSLATLVSLVRSGADRNLPWDRRVAVAVALGRANEAALARAETERCLTQASDQKLRSLDTGALYNLLVLAQAFELKFADPNLGARAAALLPPDLRKGL